MGRCLTGCLVSGDGTLLFAFRLSSPHVPWVGAVSAAGFERLCSHIPSFVPVARFHTLSVCSASAAGALFPSTFRGPSSVGRNRFRPCSGRVSAQALFQRSCHMCALLPAAIIVGVSAASFPCAEGCRRIRKSDARCSKDGYGASMRHALPGLSSRGASADVRLSLSGQRGGQEQGFSGFLPSGRGRRCLDVWCAMGADGTIPHRSLCARPSVLGGSTSSLTGKAAAAAGKARPLQAYRERGTLYLRLLRELLEDAVSSITRPLSPRQSNMVTRCCVRGRQTVWRCRAGWKKGGDDLR